MSDAPSEYRFRLGLTGEETRAVIPLVPLTVGAIFLISLVTAFLFSIFGFYDNTELEGGVFSIILKHVVLPAILEEALFRFVPIKMLGGRSPRCAVVLSAVLFGLIHTNLFQIPYAIAAGLMLAAVDLAFDSILPSVIIHLTNNLCSVLWINNSGNSVFTVCYLAVLFFACAVSLTVVLLRKARYKQYFARVLSKGEDYKPGIEIYIFTATTLILAVLALFN